MYHRRSQLDRINEQDVPESQHTIFIRGLPGSVTTSEIREFFEDSFGSCSFDFIKLSKDREKLHVAVRFESKTAARECMEKYRDGELFGYPVQLTWFRDIRRFLNHIQKQGRVRPRFNDDDRRRNQGRRNWGNLSRSRSNSRTSKSSPSRRSRSVSRSRSASVSRQSSPHSERHVVDHSRHDRDPVSTSPEPPKRSKKSKKERRKKRRHSTSQSRSRSPPPEEEVSPRRSQVAKRDASGSDMETSDGELPGSERAAARYSSSTTVAAENRNNTISSSIPVSSSGVHAAVNVADIPPPKKFNHNSNAADFRSSAANLLQNTSFTVDLDSNNPPRQHIRREYYTQQTNQPDNSEDGSRKGVFLPFSATADTLRNLQTATDKPRRTREPETDSKKEFSAADVKSEYLEHLTDSAPYAKSEKHHHRQHHNHSQHHHDINADNANGGADDEAAINAPLPTNSRMSNGRKIVPKNEISEASGKKSATPPVFNAAMTNFKTIQRLILQDVRYKAQEEEEKIGNYRLSSLSTQKSTEEIRAEKMARLSNELQEKVERKKLQLELSYRHDCETFGLMTRKLIAKDRSLEERLRLALLEIMKDLESEAMKNLDEYLDQMIFLTV